MAVNLTNRIKGMRAPGRLIHVKPGFARPEALPGCESWLLTICAYRLVNRLTEPARCRADEEGSVTMRVLLIEDDSAMARSIELMLRSEGFNVYTTDLGEEGIDLGKLYDYDIIVLDLQLPDMSGFEVLKALRVAKVQTPVLILSGNAIVEAKVKALGFGADDYMTKPFHKDELVARIQAVVRRSKGHASRSSPPASSPSISTPRPSKSTAAACT